MRKYTHKNGGGPSAHNPHFGSWSDMVAHATVTRIGLDQRVTSRRDLIKGSWPIMQNSEAVSGEKKPLKCQKWCITGTPDLPAQKQTRSSPQW